MIHSHEATVPVDMQWATNKKAINRQNESDKSLELALNLALPEIVGLDQDEVN